MHKSSIVILSLQVGNCFVIKDFVQDDWEEGLGIGI